MEPNFDLGTHARAITTSSPEAQLWFDRGLIWCFGFNHEEGVACFRAALEHDPDCAMAYWGIAYGSGPFYNMPWRDFSMAEAATCTRLCHDAVSRALDLIPNITPVEAALITALSARFPAGHAVTPEEFDSWDDAYADAMRPVYQQYGEDLDIIALFAEALMTRTPWKLWNVKTNQPADGADTLEALEALEKGIALAQTRGLPPHPAILHLHIHVLEMSATPERALDSADTLGTLCPDAGHLNHMPGHIYVLCGQYEDAKTASEKAIRADRMYLEHAGPYNFYTTARCHDLHLMMYTCMFLGQFEPALQAAREMCDTLSRDVLDVKDKPQLAMTMEGYFSMKMHVLVRFGKWQEIIETPMPECPELYCVSTSMHRYARGVAYAALGAIAEAEHERALFRKSLDRVPEARNFFNNTAHDILAIAESMLDGELEYHKGNHDIAFGRLRESVRRDDDLAYSEPWAWMHPPRHALGALLLEQGHAQEAEEVYRTDLGMNGALQRCAQHPGNIWALHGLAECLRRRGEVFELKSVQGMLDTLIKHADVVISSSCCCRKF